MKLPTALAALALALAACDTASDVPATQTFPEPANHRAEALTCGTERPATDWAEQLAIDKSMGWGPILCEDDSACTSEPDGRCARLGDGWYECTYHACTADAECGADEVCGCGAGPVGANACLKAACKVDGDCDSGWCVPTPAHCQPEMSGQDRRFECVTAADECVDDADCRPCTLEDQSACYHEGWCQWDAGQGRRVCSWQMCVM